MTSSVPLLEVRNLVVRRGGSVVLRVPSFVLHENRTVALIGPNGSGKTSLLLALARLLDSVSGELHYRGAAVPEGQHAVEYRRRLAMVFQDPLLFDLTVEDNVAAGLKLRGMAKRELQQRVAASMERFKIAHLAKRSARKLSGGEGQRTSLARAFAAQPEVILLDEPFSSLDPLARRSLIEDFGLSLHASGGAAVIASHDRDEVYRLADWVIVLDEGMVIQSGSPDEIARQPANPYVAAFFGQ
jgi:tungstate transport system ATP-binding protein